MTRRSREGVRVSSWRIGSAELAPYVHPLNQPLTANSAAPRTPRARKHRQLIQTRAADAPAASKHARRLQREEQERASAASAQFARQLHVRCARRSQLAVARPLRCCLLRVVAQGERFCGLQDSD